MTGQYIILAFSILLAIYATFYVAREHKKEKKYKKNKSQQINALGFDSS